MTLKQKMPFPWFTSLILTTSVVMFVILQYSILGNVNNGSLFSSIGAPYAIQIYLGQYWGVLTNSAIHISYPHLILNLVATLIFASFLERRAGIVRLFLLGLFASTITSLIQLTLSNDAGVGLSGVNYFFLAFIIGKNVRNPLYQLKFKYYYLAFGILTIALSYYMNTAYNYTIGIEAMSGGLLIGFLTGWSSELKYRIIPILFVAGVWIIGITTLFHAPWSAEWNYSQGYAYQVGGDFFHAKKYYNAALELEPNHEIAKENLYIINIEELSDKALTAHENEQYEIAHDYYLELLDLEPDNVWAKDNLSRLP